VGINQGFYYNNKGTSSRGAFDIITAE